MIIYERVSPFTVSMNLATYPPPKWLNHHGAHVGCSHFVHKKAGFVAPVSATRLPWELKQLAPLKLKKEHINFQKSDSIFLKWKWMSIPLGKLIVVHPFTSIFNFQWKKPSSPFPPVERLGDRWVDKSFGGIDLMRSWETRI